MPDDGVWSKPATIPNVFQKDVALDHLFGVEDLSLEYS